MIAKQTLNRLAAEAGFGANQRTTLLVKLTKFAELVERHTRSNELRIPEEYYARYEGGDTNAKSEPTARLFAQVGSTDGLCPDD